MEIPLYYNEKDIELIGTVSNIELIRLVKTSSGDYLNSELYSFEVVINFDKLLPSSALLSKFDNSWFTNNRKSLSKVVIGLDTLKYFKDYLSGRLKVKFLNIHTDVKMFNILLVLASKMSKEDNTSLPFKLSGIEILTSNVPSSNFETNGDRPLLFLEFNKLYFIN